MIYWAMTSFDIPIKPLKADIATEHLLPQPSVSQRHNRDMRTPR
jgi:hypothetical protein